MSTTCLCVYIMYDGLSNDHEKLNPVPGNEARMVLLKLNHVSRLSKYLFMKLVSISRYCNFITEAVYSDVHTLCMSSKYYYMCNS